MRRHTLTIALITGLSALAGSASAADLAQIYEMARASDPQLAAAESAMYAAGEGVVQARSSLLPNLSGSAGLGDSNSSSSQITSIPQPDGTVRFGRADGNGDTTSRTYRLQLTQTIYSQANYTRLRGARAGQSSLAASYDAALDNLIVRVAEAYFSALTATTNLEAAKAEETAVNRQLEQAQQRFEVGLSAITDVHEAQARYDGARAAAILAQNQLDDSFEALAELTGKPVSDVRPLAENITLSRPSPDKTEDWVATAEAESPLLAIRRFDLKQAEENVNTAKAAHLPTLSADYTWVDQTSWGSRSSNNLSFPAGSDFRDHGFGITLNVPIFEGFATQSRVRQESYNRDAAADRYEQEKRAVTRSTRNAFRAVAAGISEVEARKQAQISAQSALDATQAGFEVGTRTIVDVLISQQVLFQAQRDYARARHDYLLNSLRLKQAAGTITVADLQAVNALLK
ncbi:MAG: TolC family outer membrane protein [Rhodanobacteraceae bacterium]|nr:TolC family outer membrane protein [Rhodanobacteraceae bacterium]